MLSFKKKKRRANAFLKQLINVQARTLAEGGAMTIVCEKNGSLRTWIDKTVLALIVNEKLYDYFLLFCSD